MEGLAGPASALVEQLGFAGSHVSQGAPQVSPRHGEPGPAQTGVSIAQTPSRLQKPPTLGGQPLAEHVVSGQESPQTSLMHVSLGGGDGGTSSTCEPIWTTSPHAARASVVATIHGSAR
jgi:hypothetical protein